ncbi:MAG TPA: hypothetical protein VD886_02430, partial [Herpetosiphonaceae bacterium]|nr:hypothetical protein [Herpetosiphonaceae bacterium]
SYLEIDPEECTYDLFLSPTGPDGDTWEVLSSGERVTWDDDEWHMISDLTLYNEPIALPAGPALPTIAVSRMMPVDPVMPDGTGSGEVDSFDSGTAISRQYIEEWYDGPLDEGQSEIGATANVFWSLTPQPFGRPTVALDREFLERSIFLQGVPVDHWFDSQVSWGDVSSGTHTWQAASKPAEQSGVTSARTIRKTENPGGQGLGNQPVVTQVRNVNGAKSEPQTTNLWVAPEMSWCHNTTAAKLGPAVSYRCGFKFPEPAFEADVNLPAAIPWFGGKEFGIRETQASVDLEVKSTGEGSLKGQGQTGFAAMGGAIIGSMAAKGDIVLGPDGVRVPLASLELALSGKVEKEEALIKAVPAFLAAMAWLEGINRPAAQWLAKRASAKLEIEPKIQVNLEFETKGDELMFKQSEVQPGIGFKVTTAINFLEDENDEALLELRAGVGGEATVAIHVPPRPNYLKKIELKFLAFFGLRIWRFLEEGEKAWTWSSAGSADQVQGDAAAADPSWSLMDRSYLQAADYARWTGLATGALIADQQLMGNVDPLANPALALGPGGEQYLVWAHDKPGSPALSGQELAFASGAPGDWDGGWTQLTSDDRADFNPQTVALPSGRVLALWQRLDTANPGDINADPAGFMGHFQIASAVIDPGSASLTGAPLQLSAGGRLSHRPHLGALGDGALALWVANDQNQLLGASDSPDAVMWARYYQDPDQWSQPTPLLSDVAGLNNLRLATGYDPDTGISHAAAVYTLDSDGDRGTDADVELFAITGDDSSGSWAWAAPRRLTNNSLADSAPQLALAPSGAPQLVWRQGEGLRFLQGAWNAPSQPLAFGASNPAGAQLVRGEDGALALVWKEVEQHDTRIAYAFYDAEHGLWSDARTLRPDAGTHSAGGASVAVTSVEPALVANSSAGPLLALAYQMSD